MTIPALPPEAPSQAWPTLNITSPQRLAISSGKMQQSLPNLPPPSQSVPPPVLSAPPPAVPATPAATPRRSPWGAFPKGIVLGGLACGIFVGFIVPRDFWLVDWHWVWLTAAFVVLTPLVGFGRTLVVAALFGLWFGRDLLDAQPWLPVAFVGGGIVLRFLFQQLP